MQTKHFLLALGAGALLATGASAAVVGATIEAASSFDGPDRSPDHTIDGTGLDTSDPNPLNWTHDTGFPAGGGSGFFWHDAVGSVPDDASITFNLGSIVDLNAVLIWNFNATFSGGPETDRGFNQYDMFVSSDNVTYTQIVTDGTLAQASGTTSETAQVVNVAGLANGIQYVRLEADTNHGSASHTGLSEVRFDVVPEPGSLALLGLGGLALLRRRR
ncbi:PEP-CTERM sorting domain-containing protein [Phycisphaeraceae bacterium D3-23]